MMTTNQSIVDSCFFTRPDDKSRRRKRPRSSFESSPRYAAFERCMASMSERVDRQLKEENALLLDRLVQFIKQPKTTSRPTRKLRCAILQARANAGHLERAFTQLSDEILKKPASLCALTVLSAAECTQLRLTMKKIVSSTLEQGRAVTNSSNIQPHDIRLLKAWHTAQKKPLPIVIAVPNLESFTPGLISALIQHVASEPSLEFRFLLGLPTSLGQFQSTLSSTTIRMLDVERITLDSDQAALGKIIFAQFVASSAGVRLGAEAYKAVLGQFRDTTRSLEQVLTGLRYQMLCFFYANELAHLSVEPDAFASLNLIQRRFLRQLPSFKAEIQYLLKSGEQDDFRHAESLLTNDETLKEAYNAAVGAIQFYKQNLYEAVSVWEALRLSVSVQRRSFVDAYGTLLEHGLAKSSMTKELLLSLRVFPTGSIESFLEKSLERLDEGSIKDSIETFVANLSQSSSTAEFLAFTTELHAFLSNLFEQHLIHHEDLLFHELFWFNQTRTYQAAMRASTRRSLHAALTEPSLYLGDMEQQPHTATLFRLFQDSGQLVNVYDWFQAFGGEVGDEDEDAEAAQKRQQALFVRSTAELQFLGFFKSTKRKTDHVQKTFSTL